MAKLIEIKIAGQDIAPGTIKSRELAEILQSVEDMIAALMERDEKVSKEDVVIGLVSLSPGSLVLEFSSPTPVLALEAFNKIGKAVQEEKYSELPSSAINSLERIVSFAIRHNSEVDLIDASQGQKSVGVLSPSTIIKRPRQLEGETTVYGMVIRVGGAEPKVMFRTIEGITLYCDVTVSIAQDLGEQLYQTVGVEGKAKWNASDLYIEDFAITKVVKYTPKDLASTLKQLSTLTQGYFAKIYDVEKYVFDLRVAREE